MGKKKLIIILLIILLSAWCISIVLSLIDYHNSKEKASHLEDYKDTVLVFEKGFDKTGIVEARVANNCIHILFYEKRGELYRKFMNVRSPIFQFDDIDIYRIINELPLLNFTNPKVEDCICDGAYGHVNKIVVAGVEPDDIYYVNTPDGREVTVWYYSNITEDVKNAYENRDVTFE